MNESHENASSFTTQSLFFSFRYVDARAAMAWLERAFGAVTFVSYDAPDGTIQHAEMHLAGNTFMLGTATEGATAASTLYVVLENGAAVDAMYARARRAGATIVREPNDTDYGSHEFSASDLAGNAWSFGTYRPGVGAHET